MFLKKKKKKNVCNISYTREIHRGYTYTYTDTRISRIHDDEHTRGRKTTRVSARIRACIQAHASHVRVRVCREERIKIKWKCIPDERNIVLSKGNVLYVCVVHSLNKNYI